MQQHISAYLTACTYFVVSVAAEIRSSELHVAQERESTHGIATLCSILFSDGIHSCSIFTKRRQPQSCSSVVARIIRRKKLLKERKKKSSNAEGKLLRGTYPQPQSEVPFQ